MSNEPKIMFLSIHSFDKEKVLRGAFLLTDYTTKPLMFKCTNPIRPTSLQKILYGGILEKHILVELIGKPLLKSIDTPPDLIIVKDPLFLEIRPNIEIPMIRIFKDTEIVENKNDSQEEQVVMASETGKFNSVIIATHKDYVVEREKQRVVLNNIFKHHDLLEPFNRITMALEQVHLEKLGDSV